MFRSLSYAIYGHQNHHKKERREVSSFMAAGRNRHLFTAFVYEDYDGYIR
jgi:hypothetical protein